MSYNSRQWKTMIKTNVMRLLDAANINYKTEEYEVNEDDLSGMHVAEQSNKSADELFKTLVARGDKNGIAIFCIPVNCELDLKKAAMVSGNKKVEMVHMKELLGLTGYIRGGCSPIGMKKKYPTFMDETAQLFDEIGVSAGVRGAEVILNPTELAGYVGADFFDLVK